MAIRVLVINSDPAILALLRDALTAEGYAVALALSGEEGRATLLRARPDVVVLDVADADPAPGWHLLAALRRDPRDQALPVVVSVGQGAQIDAHRGLLEGSTLIVLKPYTLPALLAKVARACLLGDGAHA